MKDLTQTDQKSKILRRITEKKVFVKPKRGDERDG